MPPLAQYIYVITAESGSLDISDVFSNRRMVWGDLENQEAGK